MMNRLKKIVEPEPFDERPAALLAQELRFSFFRSLLTTSFSIMGGVVALKGLLIPSAPLNEKFFVGALMVIVGGLVAFEGQTHIIRNLSKRQASTNIWQRLAMISGPFTIGIGTGVLFSYFLDSFQDFRGLT